MSQVPELSTTDAGPAPAGGEVELRVPADSAYVAVLRTVTAGLAARCDLTLDEIEDLRIAVDEACALLLPVAIHGGSLDTTFRLAPGELLVRSSTAHRPGARLDVDGFAWTVLNALASPVEVEQGDGQLAITLVKRRGDAGA